MVGTTGCGGGKGGLTSASLAADPLLAAGIEPFFTAGTPPGFRAAIAAQGVISMVRESKQAMNTLRLPGVGWRVCFTTICFSRADFQLSAANW